MDDHKPLRLDKKQLHKIKFKRKDALRTKELRAKRAKMLRKAAQMQIEDAVKITFESAYHGFLSIVAPLIMLGSDYVVLKGGHMIPIKSIISAK